MKNKTVGLKCTGVFLDKPRAGLTDWASGDVHIFNKLFVGAGEASASFPYSMNINDVINETRFSTRSHVIGRLCLKVFFGMLPCVSVLQGAARAHRSYPVSVHFAQYEKCLDHDRELRSVGRADGVMYVKREPDWFLGRFTSPL